MMSHWYYVLAAFFGSLPVGIIFRTIGETVFGLFKSTARVIENEQERADDAIRIKDARIGELESEALKLTRRVSQLEGQVQWLTLQLASAGIVSKPMPV